MDGTDKAPRESGLRPGWQPGRSGNPAGRPKGTRNKATLLAESLLHGEAEQIIRKLIDGAIKGDPACLRLAVERLLPAMKDKPVSIAMPTIRTAQDAVEASSVLASAVAEGEVTPSEAAAVATVIEAHRRTLEVADLERRIVALEEAKRGT